MWCTRSLLDSSTPIPRGIPGWCDGNCYPGLNQNTNAEQFRAYGYVDNTTLNGPHTPSHWLFSAISKVVDVGHRIAVHPPTQEPMHWSCDGRFNFYSCPYCGSQFLTLTFIASIYCRAELSPVCGADSQQHGHRGTGRAARVRCREPERIQGNQIDVNSVIVLWELRTCYKHPRRLICSSSLFVAFASCFTAVLALLFIIIICICVPVIRR